MILYRYKPAMFEGFPKDWVEFQSVEELLEIDWIKTHSDSKHFYRFSRNGRKLIAEYGNGKEWWLVGKFHEIYEDIVATLPAWEKSKG